MSVGAPVAVSVAAKEDAAAARFRVAQKVYQEFVRHVLDPCVPPLWRRRLNAAEPTYDPSHRRRIQFQMQPTDDVWTVTLVQHRRLPPSSTLWRIDGGTRGVSVEVRGRELLDTLQRAVWGDPGARATVMTRWDQEG